MAEPILHLEDVTKKFASNYLAVNSVTLKLHQGDLVSLLGPSGCGKTTLLRLIAGFETPQPGTIKIAGRTVAGAGCWIPPEHRDVGMVFQDYALFPHLQVRKNVAFGLQNTKKKNPAEVKKRVQEALALVGLSGLENRYPHQLSGGQQQRVAVARALAPRPSLVLLDEPLSNLDVQVRLRLRQELRDILKAAGTSAIFVTHDQEEALSISDWVAVMRDGCLEQFGTPEEIYQQPASRFVAEFVTQANFLPARRRGEVWETEVGSVPVEKYPCEEDKVELMIRQEDLILQPDEAGNGVIRDRQFLGREHRYCLQMSSGRELIARTQTDNLLAVGTRVKIKVDPDTWQLFASRSCRSGD
ncbi:ABC transporter ATP-binding protein [Oscillatoria salina]|uniref:ABC transporter ATP-binding protein n=1 Tax=Oscillatoria salina TaxID=331517 RepID=UPI0013B6997D|nr:ABC transporter ATP-binding protein [Oscillatoria salina]MBZ8179606.1 ABC transporter ATP-binding protein [Oscillatoria salina IIICB1]NET87670.1 ABC transporter ATP-binding protein [Kamptonema sp. SIO1D9]